MIGGGRSCLALLTPVRQPPGAVIEARRRQRVRQQPLTPCTLDGKLLGVQLPEIVYTWVWVFCLSRS